MQRRDFLKGLVAAVVAVPAAILGKVSGGSVNRFMGTSAGPVAIGDAFGLSDYEQPIEFIVHGKWVDRDELVQEPGVIRVAERRIDSPATVRLREEILALPRPQFDHAAVKAAIARHGTPTRDQVRAAIWGPG